MINPREKVVGDVKVLRNVAGIGSDRERDGKGGGNLNGLESRDSIRDWIAVWLRRGSFFDVRHGYSSFVMDLDWLVFSANSYYASVLVLLCFGVVSVDLRVIS